MKFLLSINYLVWLVLSGLFFATGEFFSKKFVLNTKTVFLICLFIAYFFGVLSWLLALLQKNQLSIVGAIWSVISLLATVLIGILFFGEKLSAIGIIGIITAFMAIALLSLS